MKGFRPVPGASAERHLTAHRAYAEIRRRILSAELPRGSVLNEVAIARDLEISRTPLREAFRELLNEGLIEGTGPRRQVVVRSFDPDQLDELLSARQALEAIAVRAAAARVTGSAADELHLAAHRMTRAARAGDRQAWLDADEEFHAALSVAAGMPLVEELLAQLRALTRLAANPDVDVEDLTGLHTDVITLLESDSGQRVRPTVALLAQCAERLVGRDAAVSG